MNAFSYHPVQESRRVEALGAGGIISGTNPNDLHLEHCPLISDQEIKA